MVGFPWSRRQKRQTPDASQIRLLAPPDPKHATHIAFTCTPDWMPAFSRVPQTGSRTGKTAPLKFLLTLDSIKKIGIKSFIITYEGETVGIIEADRFPGIFVSLVAAVGSMAWVHGTRTKETIDLVIPETVRCKELLSEFVGEME